MAHKRTNFTDRQKARIYVRDRATCSFSGLSLWLPDRGVSSTYLSDWVDHVVPSARGGLATLDNGVCASNIHNADKGNRGGTTTYLFREGRITWEHVESIGAPSEALLADLERRAALVESDWYLNRAIEKALDAFWWRAELELHGWRCKRDDVYWFRTGWKKFGTYLRTRPEKTAIDRGLVPDPMPHGTPAMMEIERVGNEADYVEWAETLWPMYWASERAIHGYDRAEDDGARREAVAAAVDDPLAHPDIGRALAAMSLAPATPVVANHGNEAIPRVG